MYCVVNGYPCFFRFEECSCWQKRSIPIFFHGHSTAHSFSKETRNFSHHIIYYAVDCLLFGQRKGGGRKEREGDELMKK